MIAYQVGACRIKGIKQFPAKRKLREEGEATEADFEAVWTQWGEQGYRKAVEEDNAEEAWAVLSDVGEALLAVKGGHPRKRVQAPVGKGV